jgi:hypothetical protein
MAFSDLNSNSTTCFTRCAQGAIDPNKSLFRNQFNILLCLDEAKAVLRHHGSFASFKIIPSASSNNVQFNFYDLDLAGSELETPDSTLTKQMLT